MGHRMLRPVALGALLSVLILLAPTVGAGHIALVTVVSTPLGGGAARFDYVLLGTGAPGGGGLHIELGDGNWVCILAPLDVYQPTGLYFGDLFAGPCHASPPIGIVPYTMTHPVGGLLQEAQATFVYTYAAPGTYVGSWWTCCGSGGPSSGPLVTAAI